MSYSIHGVFQKYNLQEGNWESVITQYEFSQDYQLFSVLAGVCSSYINDHRPTQECLIPISSQRGLPEDFNTNNKAPEVFCVGNSNHSWLYVSEILRWANTAPCNLKQTLAYFLCEVQRLENLHGRVRFVFGFNSCKTTGKS